MSVRWGQAAAVGASVLGVVGVAVALKRNDPIEIIWTGLGAAGSVYAWQVFVRRWRVNEWRKAKQINGAFKITAEQHVVLRGLGFGIQLLILTAGLGAMFDVGRLFVIGALIGVASLAALASWYAERKADQQAEFFRTHPEE